MAEGDVLTVEQRRATPEEVALVEWFEKQRAGQVETLEAAARQIIQLVSAFFGILFGILALGSDKLEASLSSPLVIGSAVIAVLTLLAAMLLASKARTLSHSMLAFCVGVAALAGLILVMLLTRA